LIVLTGLLMAVSLASLSLYLLLTRKQLRQAQSAHERLSSMLINAEEHERSRVASELHDDYSQRLAIIALKLENLAETVSPLSEQADQQFHDISDSVGELGADLHTLSHQLHSSVLENLGLVPAIRALCKEFTAQQKIEVDFTSDDIPRLVPRAELCIFRIIQEGLRNLKKHSGAQHARVSLRANASGLIVGVLDKGCGFDLNELSHQNGLGVRIMEGRIHSLGGKLKIQSVLGTGTTVTAWVPLALDSLGELRLREQIMCQ
jgi:signal transduction histidine kinase